jgi:hypothetical protein
MPRRPQICPVVNFPADPWTARKLQLRRKLAELIKKRDRLNMRIDYLMKYLDVHMTSDEAQQRQQAFWQNLLND